MCLLVVGCVNIYCDQDKLLLRGVEDLSDKDQLHLPPFSSCSLPFVARGIIAHAPSPLPPLPIVCWLLVGVAALALVFWRGIAPTCFFNKYRYSLLHSRLLDTIDTTLHICNIDDGRYTTP